MRKLELIATYLWTNLSLSLTYCAYGHKCVTYTTIFIHWSVLIRWEKWGFSYLQGKMISLGAQMLVATTTLYDMVCVLQYSVWLCVDISTSIRNVKSMLFWSVYSTASFSPNWSLCTSLTQNCKTKNKGTLIFISHFRFRVRLVMYTRKRCPSVSWTKYEVISSFKSYCCIKQRRPAFPNQPNY